MPECDFSCFASVRLRGQKCRIIAAGGKRYLDNESRVMKRADGGRNLVGGVKKALIAAVALMHWFGSVPVRGRIGRFRPLLAAQRTAEQRTHYIIRVFDRAAHVRVAGDKMICDGDRETGTGSKLIRLSSNHRNR